MPARGVSFLRIVQGANNPDCVQFVLPDTPECQLLRTLVGIKMPYTIDAHDREGQLPCGFSNRQNNLVRTFVNECMGLVVVLQKRLPLILVLRGVAR